MQYPASALGMAERWHGRLHRTRAIRLPLVLAVVAVGPYGVGLLVAGGGDGGGSPQWLVFALLFVAGLAAGLVFERRREARITRYRRAVRRIGRGDFGAALHVTDLTGWGALAAEIDHAAANLATVRGDHEERLADKEVELGRMRAELARLSQDNVGLQQGLLVHEKTAASLAAFVVAVNQLGDPPQVAGQLLTYLDSELDYTIATVMLVDQEKRQAVPVAIANREKGLRLVGNYVKEIQSFQPFEAMSAIGRVLEAGKPLLIADVNTDRRGLASRPGIRSELAVPLKVQDKVIGVVHLESAQAETYSVQDESLVTWLANTTATAIGNVRLREEEAKVRMLREMDKMKSQLISTVSHELRTPLASIKGYSTSLQRPEGKLDEETRREFLQIIEDEADRLSEMIENLLDQTKIEAGVLHLHKQPVPIERIVRKVLEHVKRRGPQARFRVRFPDDFPLVAVAPHRIEQVVHNLVENAVKYAPESSRILISGEVEGDRVIISVSDEGPGIPPEHRQRVFEPFFQVDGGTARRVGGTGLGLAICRGFVEAHGGRIWVDSDLGRGSTFRFSLPVGSQDEGSDAELPRIDPV